MTDSQETRDAGLDPEEDRPVKQGRNIITVIGIDDYQPWRKLSNAVSDAQGIRKLFVETFGFEEPLLPLFDHEATKSALFSLVEDQLRAVLKPDDSLILFFAGHGHTCVDKLDDEEIETGYLIPVNAQLDQRSDYIPVADWLGAISKLPARHILVILDACHSGFGVGKEMEVYRDTAPYEEDLIRRRSRKILTSAKRDQRALDGGPIAGHSLFTGNLIDGLRWGKADWDGNGLITGSELGLYVQQQVAQHSQSKQTKQTPDFGSFRLDRQGEIVIKLGGNSFDMLKAQAFSALQHAEMDRFALLVTQASQLRPNSAEVLYLQYRLAFYQNDIARAGALIDRLRNISLKERDIPLSEHELEELSTEISFYHNILSLPLTNSLITIEVLEGITPYTLQTKRPQPIGQIKGYEVEIGQISQFRITNISANPIFVYHILIATNGCLESIPLWESPTKSLAPGESRQSKPLRNRGEPGLFEARFFTSLIELPALVYSPSEITRDIYGWSGIRDAELPQIRVLSVRGLQIPAKALNLSKPMPSSRSVVVTDAKNIYALLVGINEYPVGQSLRGCVRDVQGMEEFLRTRVIFPQVDGPINPDDHLQIKTLLNEQATRGAIINNFESHLGQAEDGDVALFYFCGCGSEENAPPDLWHLKPTHKNQTLVCYDSRSSDTAWDLADEELSYLISQVAQNKPDLHILIVIDSCHSGSRTRGQNEVEVRMETPDPRRRKLIDYIGLGSLPKTMVRRERSLEGKLILMTACRQYENAHERILDHEMRGVFSYHLLTALQGADPHLTYRDLANHVMALVGRTEPNQTPQLEAGSYMDQPIFKGQIEKKLPIFTARFDTDLQRWIIDGGIIHGISPETEPKATQLALFPNLEAARTLDLTLAKGQAIVTHDDLTKSEIAGIYNGKPLDKQKQYQALLVGIQRSRVLVRFEGADALLAPIRENLATINQDGISQLAKEATTSAERESADMLLEALTEKKLYRIGLMSDLSQLVVDISFDESAVYQAIDRMRHMARWLTLYKLTNPHTSIAYNDVELEVYIIGANGDETLFRSAGELRLTYNAADEPPQIKIKIVNHWVRELYCALFNLTSFYEVHAIPSEKNNKILNIPGGGGEAWLFQGNPIPMQIPDDKWEAGLTEVNTVFKVIASTTEFDARLLEQNALQTNVRVRKDLRGFENKDIPNRPINQFEFRALGFDEAATSNDFGWCTKDLVVVTTRPKVAKLLRARREIDLGSDIILANNSDMTATARLMSEDEVGRRGIPIWLRDDDTKIMSFVLNPIHIREEPGSSVLELENAVRYESVSKDNSLKLAVPVILAENEYVLPIGFDGEFYLPLGRVTNRVGRTEITLERLPDPESTNTLVNSIRVYFQKLIADTLGLKSIYPRLAIVEGKDSQIVYNDDPRTIATRISEANRILLYIHGIIGGTRHMVSSAWEGELEQQVADRYDLILAFDYENLSTNLSNTAEALRDKLGAVGLVSGHNKTLHIFAHSIGGLIARWLIEQLDGGDELVQHLFLFGTPNGGSSWTKLEDYVIGLLAIGLNSLAPITWPVSTATALLAFIEKQDKLLDQVVVSSQLLEVLARSRDPNVPYTIFAGNTSIIKAVRQGWTGQSSLIERLLNRVDVHNIAGLTFFNEPNDVAVSVESIFAVPDDRIPAPIKRVVACDHMTYFEPTGGLPDIKMVLWSDGSLLSNV